ncbi:uncharacterized protein LOC114720817 [Neltuma alba]|uniref:uncharacterized protein LOC114720817 n=1 Tax=Neltuma alba TaxID=207710 RepID=UPI0010A2C022|nr:uncharacterized protein LOC114720817 [Prosopis alba]
MEEAGLLPSSPLFVNFTSICILLSLSLFSDGNRVDLSRVFAVSFAGFVAVSNALLHRHAASKQVEKDDKIIPKLERTESGRVGKLEKFSHYVAMQMGFEDPEKVPGLCKLANDFLRKTKDCEASIYGYFDKEDGAESLYEMLIHEFDRCILTYFAFHWNQASAVISQALSSEPGKQTRLKEVVLAATRKLRFERVTKVLKVTRVFSTLVEEMKVVRGESQCTDVMVPMALGERSPVLLLMGWGAGAGKSTLLQDILKEPFWERASKNAVVVDADAFKESDVIYEVLNSRGHHDDMLQTSESLIGWKEGEQNLLMDLEEIKCLESIGNLNAEADSIYELHKPSSPALGPGSIWNDIVLSPSRETDQKVLRGPIWKIEKLPTN